MEKVLGQSLTKEGGKTAISADLANDQAKTARSVDEFVKAFPGANRAAATEALVRISQNRYGITDTVRVLAKVIKKEAMNGKEIDAVLGYLKKQNEAEIKAVKQEVESNPYGKKDYLIRDLPIVQEDLIKLKLNPKEKALLESDKKISTLDKEDSETFKGILRRYPGYTKTNCWAYLNGNATLESLYEKKAELDLLGDNSQ
ncbi:MAG: hypothetical protein QMC36_08330 [Patescibacteria group bacterium]